MTTAKEIARKFSLLKKWANLKNKDPYLFDPKNYPDSQLVRLVGLILDEVKNQIVDGRSWKAIELETIIADP